MAHIPDIADDFDASLPADDPVVRMPKSMVRVPDAPTFASKTVVAVGAVGMLIGATLGLVGVGIVYATQRTFDDAPAASAPRRPARTARARTQNGSGVFTLLPAGADGGAPAEPYVPTGPEAGYAARQQRIGRGRTLPTVLRALGVAGAQGSRVIRALRGLVNMRALQPSDVVVVQRDPASGNDVRRVEYRRSPTQVWAVTINADGSCEGQHIEVVRSTARVAAGFRVDDTLEAALRGAGLHPDVTARLEEVFPQLDLGRELRHGDAVRIIIEEERLNGSFWRYGRVEAIDYRGAMGRRRAFFQALSDRGGDFFDREGRTWERGPLRSPLDAMRMTSPFNMHRVHPVLHRPMPHLGCDFGAPTGEPVYAAAEGTVLSVGNGGAAGNVVRIAHPAIGIETGYAHLSRFAPGLRSGMHVRARALVGYVGSTGRSTGPHLHMSVKRAGQFVDPQLFLGIRRVVPPGLRAEFDQMVARLDAEIDAIRVAGEMAPAPTEPPAEDPVATEEEPSPAEESAPADETLLE